jgi:hypothetical protein
MTEYYNEHRWALCLRHEPTPSTNKHVDAQQMGTGNFVRKKYDTHRCFFFNESNGINARDFFSLQLVLGWVTTH